MAETQQVEEIKEAKAPAALRARILLLLGWTLLLLSLGLLSFHMLWMWNRIGRGAPLVAVGLVLDALVGIGLIVAARRTRRTQ